MIATHKQPKMQCTSSKLNLRDTRMADIYRIIFLCTLGLHVPLVGGKLHSTTSCRQPSSRIHSCFASSIPATGTIIMKRNRGYQMVAAPESNDLLSSSYTNSINLQTSTSAPVPELFSVDVRYNSRSALTYDETTGRYLDDTSNDLQTTNNEEDHKINIISRFLQSAFVPEGVTPSYYRFMRWRILQRFVNANVHVIGTQSLLMGLRGMHKGNGGVGAVATGAAAATNWVLKDTLGKIVRMVWASKMGRKFDPDAKRWRFRSSLIYALGNGLEVSTYLHPQYFLVLAMLANSCKQMSMLTSSATRNALYNSFKRIDGVNGGKSIELTNGQNSTAIPARRGASGATENIGDITAKGEAQIAVVDLLGIASGICLSRAVGVSVKNVFAVWIVLQVLEIFCMHKEIRAVVYKTFNFERMYTLLGEMLEDDNDSGVTSVKLKTIPTPDEIAAGEKIFLPPDHLARRAIAFGSPGRTQLDPDELTVLVNDIFRGEKYFLVVGQDLKNARGLSAKYRQWKRRRANGTSAPGIDPQEQCHIVLHADANNLDIVKSALALVILRRKLVKLDKEMRADGCSPTAAPLRSRDCTKILREARIEADEIFPNLLRELTKQGWHPPLRSMLGRVSARAEWPIQKQKGGFGAYSTVPVKETITLVIGDEEG